MSGLVLKRASLSRPSGEWNDDDFDVLADGVVVGRIFEANAAPAITPWMWTLIFPHHQGRSPTHGYNETREAAMVAFAKSWRPISQPALPRGPAVTHAPVNRTCLKLKIGRLLRRPIVAACECSSTFLRKVCRDFARRFWRM